MTLADRFEAAPDFEAYLERVDKNQDLWRNLHKRATLDDGLRADLQKLPPLHLLALSEDWCGDAVNILPVVALMAEAAPNLDFKVLERDGNPDLMDAHLTRGTRSIPIIIVFDPSFEELAWWGPRPKELQAWVVGAGSAIESRERYRRVRAWYARDRGRTAASEIFAKLTAAGAPSVA
jgi:hypothetical protein